MFSTRKVLALAAAVGLTGIAAVSALAAPPAKLAPKTPEKTFVHKIHPALTSASGLTTQIVSNPALNQPGQTNEGDVQCPPGTTVTGGGAFGVGPFENLNGTYPESPNGWAASMTNLSATTPEVFYVYAVCLG